MPNWCSTKAVIHGNTEDVKNIKTFIETVVENPSGDAEENHRFSALINAIGDNAEKCCCRGYITDINDVEIDKDFPNEAHFFIESADAWSPILPEIIARVINRKFPDALLLTYYIAEECGMEIYINTDTTGQFFPEKYILDTEEDTYYFENDEELIAFVQKKYNASCTTLEEVVAWADEQDNIWLHEFTGE